MAIVKALHVLCVFVWIGNLLALTRLMGYHVKEDELTQRNLARLYKRMYSLVGLPSLILAIAFGVTLLMNLPNKPAIWFHIKMTFFIPLLICDFICGRYVTELNKAPDLTRGIKYKVLHGMCGLMLLGIIVTIYVGKS